jgi:CDP-diacylglycerol pyrophosphatase
LARICKKENLVHCWWECKLVQPFWKKIRTLLKNLNIDLPYDPAIPLLENYPKECDTANSQRHLHIHVFCSATHTSQVLEKPKMLHYR